MDDWITCSRHEWTVLTLPDRHWKWRMRHASITFAEQVNRLSASGDALPWDAIFTNDMMNVAEFRGLVAPEVRRLPTTIYFHENQFAYPNQAEQSRDFHFAFTNLTSAIAADHLWFNSHFNFESMSTMVAEGMKKWPDFLPVEAWDRAKQRAQIQYPGIRVSPDDLAVGKVAANGRLHIVWAARWEHDKGPHLLGQILDGLVLAGIEFTVSIIGQQFRKWPDAFDLIQSRHADRIVQWGFLPSRKEYLSALAKADLFLSTADHEFFGLSVAEAICCGARPLLPNRLSYPELISLGRPADAKAYLYDGTPEDAVRKIAAIEYAHRAGENVHESAFFEAFHANLALEQRARVMDDAIEVGLV